MLGKFRWSLRVLGCCAVIAIAGVAVQGVLALEAAQPKPAPAPKPPAAQAPATPPATRPPATPPVVNPPVGPSQAAPAQPTAPTAPRERLPAPVELSGADMLTKDGVQLRATFYPSNRGKDATVVMLVHGWKGSRKDFARLAPFLQQQGYAVLAPDLRGHGDSVQRLLPAPAAITADRLGPRDVAAMVNMDLETCKKFLLAKNNAGELNIEKLCVVGLDVGATVALDWARFDWSWPVYPGLKQGQDVKALVLISPKWSFTGLSVQAATAHPAVRVLSFYLMVGKDSSKDMADAQRIYNILARFHPSPKDNPELQDLFFAKFPTSVQGKELLVRFEQPVFQSIVYFIEQRVAKQPFPWQDRSKRKEE